MLERCSHHEMFCPGAKKASDREVLLCCILTNCDSVVTTNNNSDLSWVAHCRGQTLQCATIISAILYKWKFYEAKESFLFDTISAFVIIFAIDALSHKC